LRPTGGELNVQRNVVKGLQADGMVKLNKVTTDGVGTSYQLELTAAGEAKVNSWLARRDLGQLSQPAQR
jgi:hypothetical protein